MELCIKLTWDSETCVWIAESPDVPGLILESGSFDALIERLRLTIPEMLQLNGGLKTPLYLNFISERHEQVAI
jgi:hypothetical protein